MKIWQSRRIVSAGRWLTSALLVGIALPFAASAATSRLAVAFPPVPADGDVGVVLANPADARVSAVVSAADDRGVLLTDGLETTVDARGAVGLFAPDVERGAASVHVEADGFLRGAIVVRDADGTTLDAQLVPGEAATTLAFPIAPGTAGSTAIGVVNAGVAPTDVRVVALDADGSALAVLVKQALAAGAEAAFAAADAFAPEVLGALATVQVRADQPLVGSAIADGSARNDVTLTAAPTRAGAARGLPLFAEGGGVALETAVQVFNPGTSAVTVSAQALDASGTVLEDVPGGDSIPALGSLVLDGPWPRDATWLRINADGAVVAQATVSSAAGGIATIPAADGAGYALTGTEDGAILIAMQVVDGQADVVSVPGRSWRLFASAPATSSGSVQAAIAGDPCQPYTPIGVGETKSGALAVGDCRSPIYGSSYFADRYSFTGTTGQQIVVTVTGAPVRLSLVRDSDGNLLASGGFTGSVARLPNSGSFTLPTSGTFLIEVASVSADGTGAYQVTLGSPTAPFPVAGRVMLRGAGLANVPLTFTRVTGSGTLPTAVTTDADGYWFQNGFQPGTTYRITPSLAPYVFAPASRDFSQAAALDFFDNLTTSSTTSSTTTSSTTSSTTTTVTTSSTTSSTRPSTTTSTTSSTTTSSTPSTTSSSTTTTVTTSSTTSTTSPTTTSSTTTTVTTSSTTSTIRPSTSTTTTPTTSSTTTTTIPGCGTEATFDSIACRLGALADRVGSEVTRSSLRDRLLGALGSALSNVQLAESQTSAGRVPQARVALENAYDDLSKFVQRLNLSRRRRLLAPGVAGALATEGRAIRRSTATLEGTL